MIGDTSKYLSVVKASIARSLVVYATRDDNRRVIEAPSPLRHKR